MNKLALLRLGALALLAVAACEPDVTLEQVLQNKQCRAGDFACVAGYHCDRTKNTCVRDDGAGGAGGTSSQSGAGGTGAVTSDGGSAVVGPGGAAGSGGDTAQGGAGGSAGTTTDVPDAAVPQQDAGGDGCVPGVLYEDVDGDGYGSGAAVGFGCPHDNLVQSNDDCLDVDVIGAGVEGENIHPGQTAYFNVSYPAVGKPDDRSFDYDCSGEEDADPTNTPPGPVPNCGGLVGTLEGCTGSGFLPDDRRPDGNGINSLCGSESIASCELSGGVLCVGGAPEATVFIYRCK